MPLTLLRLRPEIAYAVVEMGAAKAGDIDWLCELARPTVALLLNAMPAHLQGFGSVDGVAAAKGEIFDRLGASGVAVINADQPWAKQWRSALERPPYWILRCNSRRRSAPGASRAAAWMASVLQRQRRWAISRCASH